MLAQKHIVTRLHHLIEQSFKMRKGEGEGKGQQTRRKRRSNNI